MIRPVTSTNIASAWAGITHTGWTTSGTETIAALHRARFSAPISRAGPASGIATAVPLRPQLTPESPPPLASDRAARASSSTLCITTKASSTLLAGRATLPTVAAWASPFSLPATCESVILNYISRSARPTAAPTLGLKSARWRHKARRNAYAKPCLVGSRPHVRE